MKCQITTHVLDLIKGTPANNIPAVLEKLNNSESWEAIGNGTTIRRRRYNLIGNLSINI